MASAHIFKIQILLSPLFLALAISGCGQAVDHNYDIVDTHTYHFNPEARRRYLEETKNVLCGVSGKACPESVGVLYSANIDSNSTSQCTGSMVTPDLFLTNAHCVKEYNADPALGCTGKVFVHLPNTTNAEYEILACAAIILSSDDASSDTTSAMDFAFIKLKTATRRKLTPIRDTGVRQREQLTAWVGNRRLFNFTKIEPLHLKNIQGSVFLKNTDNDFSEELLLAGDEVVPGNSGSPVLDATGMAVAVLHAIYTPEDSGWVHYPKKAYFSLGTNLSCVPGFRLETQDPRRGCDERYGRNRRATFNLPQSRLAKALENVRVDHDQWLKSNPAARQFGWDIKNIKGSRDDGKALTTLVFEPKCLQTTPKVGDEIALARYEGYIDVDAEGQPNLAFRRIVDPAVYGFKVLNVTLISNLGPVRAIRVQRKGPPDVISEETLDFTPCLKP